MKKYIKQNNIIKGDIVDNNNKQLFTRMYGVAIVLILGVLSLSVQAQYANEPTDFDRLLSGEFNAVNPPAVTGSDCDTGTSFDCSGVLYLRLSPTLNIGASTATGGNQLVVRMEARAGQEAIGIFSSPEVCPIYDVRGTEVALITTTPEAYQACPEDESALIQGVLATLTPIVPRIDEVTGNIDADNSANLLYNVEARFTYSKGIFPGDPDNFTTVCTGATNHLATQVSPTTPRNVASSVENGVDYLFV